MSLSVRDREAFFAEPHVAALSVADDPGRGPLTVPIWYQYAPGGEAWVLTPAGSRKARLIAAADRFTLGRDLFAEFRLGELIPPDISGAMR